MINIIYNLLTSQNINLNQYETVINSIHKRDEK